MSWYDPRNPSQLQSEPWLAPKIIDRLESILHPDFEVMEFGGGGSTLWFAERVRRVVCYENNLEWYTALDNKNLDNVVLQFGSFPLEEETDKDLLLIDGEPVRLRAGWLREAQRIVKRGGWIILDNANRREYARERADLSAFAVLEYQSELVGKHLITEIWKVLCVGQNPNRSADAERFESTFVAVITHLPNTTTAYHAKRFEVVRACLTTMRENAKMPHTFIVWDNGSEQTFRNWLQDVFRPDVLILSKNVGKVTARTTLGRMIPPEAVIAISDDDMLYEDDWLVPQIELLQHFPNVACVSGYAVRTAFRWGVENTIAWAREYAAVERGRFMSRESENDFAVSIGRDPAWHEAYTKDDVDYRVTYNGKSAYCTAHHCQFVTTGETIRKLPQYDDKALGEERSFDIGMDALGLRLSTINRLSRHIGNVMDESMRKTIGV